MHQGKVSLGDVNRFVFGSFISSAKSVRARPARVWCLPWVARESRSHRPERSGEREKQPGCGTEWDPENSEKGHFKIEGQPSNRTKGDLLSVFVGGRVTLVR